MTVLVPYSDVIDLAYERADYVQRSTMLRGQEVLC